MFIFTTPLRVVKYTLEVERVYELNASSDENKEAVLCAGPAAFHKQLLWHGSRLTNYMGILSQGQGLPFL